MSADMNRPEILNCLTMVGVCVVARDGLELLYCNDAYRRIKNRLWPEETVRSLNTELSRQMLDAAEASEYGYSMVFVDPNSAEELDVTCSVTMWNETHPAYVLTFSEHKRVDETNLMMGDRQLIDALKRVYPMVMLVNLTKDTYAVTETASNESFTKATGKYSALHLQGLARTHPDYQEVFARKFSRENLLARYNAGEQEDYLEAKQLGPDKVYHWSSTHAIRVHNPYNDDVLQYILIRPIDDQRELENEVDRVRSEANRYRNAITMTYDHIYEINAQQDRVYEIKINNGIVADRAELGSVHEMNRALILDRMHPSNRETYGEEFPWMRLLPENGHVGFDMDVYEDDWYMRQSNGEYRWERIQIVPNGDDPNEIMIFSKDIHEVKLREEKQRELLFEALANAEHANSAKRDFLSHMSHDMRTPMNAIVGLTTIAQTKIGDTEKVADALSKIQTSSQHLLRLINEVLDMSRIENGKITLEEETFNISELLENAMTSISTQAREKNQTVVVDTQNLSRGLLIGDRFRLEQVLLNLLSNAVKYTGDDGVIILSMCDTPSPHENVTNLTICVEDNGFGMSKEFVSRLFDPFEREVRPETADIQGTGLGLPIVKSIVERMNGTIRVDSAIGMGTCFAVNIPMKIPAGSAGTGVMEQSFTGETDCSISEDKYAGYRFLLVDDNELNREIGQEILQMFGAKVDLACDGQEAITIIFNTPDDYYDAIFMDVQMPVKNGYDATRELRASDRPDIKHLPIFAMTANAFADDVQDALDAGMNAHLAKPLDIATLVRVLDRYLRKA